MLVPTCPRCDYDLSGLVATWVTSCPMQAVCSECGLAFDCTNVLSPRMLGPRWSFEHAPRPAAGRWLRTSLMALRPSRLCAEMRIDHAVRRVRLAQFAILWLLAVHLASVAGRVGAFSFVRVWFGGGTSWLRQIAASLEDDRLDLLGTLLMPYAGPIQVPVGARTISDLPMFPIYLLTFIPTVCMPVWMMILGATLAKARVRRVHLLRGLAYSLPGAGFWALFICAGVAACDMARGGVMGPAWSRWELAMAGLMLAFPVYHGLWWWMFIRRYLRLPHALATVLLLMIMSGLVFIIVLTLIALKVRF